jgi:hypothetical protein
VRVVGVGIALVAGEFVAEVGGAAFGSEDPWAEGPGWAVADVLRVAAFEVGHPVAIGVLVKGDDLAVGHGGISPQRAQSSQRRKEGKEKEKDLTQRAQREEHKGHREEAEGKKE